ncbi:MAG: type II secretion system protein [Minisyncoccia bacterium]
MSKKAFTLIELAVVLLVIGILAGVVLRNIGGFTASARDSRRISDLRNVQTYLSQYFLRQGTYPDVLSWASLEVALRKAGVLSTGTPLVNDPVKGRYYNYSFCTTTDNAPHYVIWAVLEASNINNAPQLFKDSATGRPADWGWGCHLPQGVTEILCATSTGAANFCLTQ